jgi:hypothetical protein
MDKSGAFTDLEETAVAVTLVTGFHAKIPFGFLFFNFLRFPMFSIQSAFTPSGFLNLSTIEKCGTG